MLISVASRDLIVAEEVSSRAVYEKRYTHPEWPGGSSGVTIGIGYDVGAGVKSAAQLHADWSGKIPDAMIVALEPCVGQTGSRASILKDRVRNAVTVPWDAAISVFDNVDTPRWYAICVRHLPNFETLSLDCRGALLSLAYNRGPSFENSGDRYREMRAIKAHMQAKEFGKIPAEFRSMKRLWSSPSMRGLVLRREHEAQLFERGLTQPGTPFVEKPIIPPAGSAVIPPTPIATPATPPKPTPAHDAVVAGGLTGIAGVLAGVWTYAQEHMLTIVLILLALVVIVLVAFRFIKGHWPWTSFTTSPGVPSQESSPLSLPRSAPSLALPLVQPSPARLVPELDRALEGLRAARSLTPLASKPRRKRSAKPSQKIHRRATSSPSSKRNAAKKSARKQSKPSRR